MAAPDDVKGHVKSRAALPRDFAYLWNGSAASQLGSMNAAIALPLLALSLTHSPAFAGWVAAVGTGPRLLLYLPAGMVADRFNRRRIMLTCQYTRFAISTMLAVGLVLDFHPGHLLVAAAAAEGALAALYNMTEVTVVPRIVPADALPEAMARNEARSHIAMLLGRPLGGFLYGLHRSLPFVADAASSLFSAFTLHCMQHKGFRAEGRTDRELSGFRECFRLLMDHPFLWMMLIIFAVTNFAFQTIFLMLIIQADREFASTSMIGILFAASGFGGTLGAVVAPRFFRRYRLAESGREMLVPLFCVWGWFVMTSIVAIGNGPLTGLAAWAGISFIGAHMNVALTVYQATRVPDENLARVASVTGVVTQGAVPLGSLSAGYLLSLVSNTSIVTGIVMAVTLAVAVFSSCRLSLKGRVGWRFFALLDDSRAWRGARAAKRRAAREDESPHHAPPPVPQSSPDSEPNFDRAQ
ncbi:MFS transporter [Actinomadura decatromicini]|uniref:MFS transporter n=1 Tax=Actinomadura decatromicini TaxID=2604572 RepID=A0A5D3FXX5_9ACTN|nr:MFS transporter [Actinomadura decatromicini]TYK52869.1 MFS transporter [Actinomadura decatromicini]